jgi:hypothetical protein
VKPLRSPIAEFDALAAVQLAAGAGTGIAVTLADGPGGLLAWTCAGAFFGTFMYLLAYRRFARDAVKTPAEAPAAAIEPTAETHQRSSAYALAQAVVVVLLALSLGSFVLGGFLAGNGCALLVVSRSLSRWERRYGARLLRAPERRWRGWRGRGMLDPADYYLQSAQAAPGSGR